MQASPDDIDLASLWAAIMRNRWRLLLSSLLAGGLTYAILASMRPQFTSQASVIIEAQDSSYARARGAEARPVENKIDDVEVASQVEIVRAQDALLKIARDKQLEKNAEINTVLEPRGMLGIFGFGDQSRMSQDERILFNLDDRLRVYQLAKTRLISIDFTSRDPKFAADIANAVATAYLERSRAAGLRDAVDATESLSGKIDEVRKSAELAQADLERFRASAGLLSGQNNVTFAQQQLSELNTQRVQVETVVGEATARAKLVRLMLAEGAIEAAPEVLRAANMQQLFQQRIRIERDIAELSATLLPAHPRMRQLGGELSIIKTRIQEEGRKVARSLDNEAEVARARMAAIVKNIDTLSKQQASSSDAQARLGVLEREAQSKRETYQTMLDRLNDASTRRDSLSVPAKAVLNSSATASSVPVFPKKTQFSLLAVLGTFLAGLALVITRELVVAARSGGLRRVAQREGAEYAAAAAGARPSHHNGGERASNQFNRPVTTAAPQLAPVLADRPVAYEPVAIDGAFPVRSLSELSQFILRQSANGPGYRTLLTGQGDGIDVSQQAIELSRFLAANGKKVVLVEWDTDGVGPSDRLKLNKSPGFRELAGHSAMFEDVIQPDPKSTVHVIAAGNPAALPSGEAADRQMGLVFDALDEIYDHVVVGACETAARLLFERADGRFDAGVMVVPPGPTLQTGAGSGFLGYDVPTLSVIRLLPPAMDRRDMLRASLKVTQSVPVTPLGRG